MTELDTGAPTRTERWMHEQEHILYPDEEHNHVNCRACGPGPIGLGQVPSAYPHVWYEAERLEPAGGYDFHWVRDKAVSPSKADVVSSEIEKQPGWHTPMLDIDMYARLIESSTPGHFHLYIDRRIKWRKYKKLLRALRDTGIIEPGFYRASVKRKATHLRPPWKEKQ